MNINIFKNDIQCLFKLICGDREFLLLRFRPHTLLPLIINAEYIYIYMDISALITSSMNILNTLDILSINNLLILYIIITFCYIFLFITIKI